MLDLGIISLCDLIFNDTYAIFSTVISFWAMGIDEKCKNLLILAVVTLWEFCWYRDITFMIFPVSTIVALVATLNL